jgi:hypothetical protein
VNKVLTVIRYGATSEGGFGSMGRLHEVDINHIDYETYNDLYDGDIVDSVMPVCLAVLKILAKATDIPIFDQKSTRSEW